MTEAQEKFDNLPTAKEAGFKRWETEDRVQVRVLARTINQQREGKGKLCLYYQTKN